MSNSYDIEILRRTIELLFENYPELKEDETLKNDMLEGATDFYETMEKLLRRTQDAIYLSNACKSAMQDIGERKARFDKRVEFGKELMKRLMEVADRKNMEFPTGTITIKTVPPSVVVYDEYSIPDDFMRIKKEPNKVLLKEMLEKMDVPGVTLSNGGTTIAIRGT